MSEQKAMSRDEMVVGSYVCSMHMNGMEGEVVAVEIDERGPEYDILRVQMNGWELPQGCQRVAMMLAERPELVPVPKVEQGATVQWRHDTMRDGVWRRGTAEMWGWEEQLWYVRDAEGFLVKVAADEANIMVAKDGLPLTAEEQLAALKADLEAYRSTFEEVNEAYHKTHSERYTLNEQNVELRGECDALRAKLVALEEGAAASRNTARQVAQIAHDRGHEIAHIESREREARAEAAAQRERADMWQAAAQDALGQMAHWRKQAKEGTKLCDTVVGIDFRSTRPIERKLAEVAAEVAAAVASHDDVRRG